MLFQLLDQVCTEISKLDIKQNTPLMLQEIRRARPDVWESMKKKGANDEVIKLISVGIAAGVLTQIKEIPTIVDMMVAKVKAPRTDPALRCALVGVLAYLVQPHDIIPDNAPGGYGYIDDCAILRAGLIEYMNTLPSDLKEAKKQGDHLNAASSMVPRHLVPALQQALTGVSLAFQILRSLPAELIEATTQIAINNPLQAAVPQPPPSFVSSPGPTIGGNWSGGAYFEGGNVVVPGGPSLIDGQLFIPD